MKSFTSLVALKAFLSRVVALPSTGPQKSRPQTNPPGVEVSLVGVQTTNPNDQCSVWVPSVNQHIPASLCQCSIDTHANVLEDGSDINRQLLKLSISSVVYEHTVAECYFTSVDSSLATANQIVESNGQLGPPQEITEVSSNCICD